MSSAAFQTFAIMLKSRFKSMSENELFRVDLHNDVMWPYYLNAFPPGTNEIFRVRTEHDGSIDRHFIRDLGNVVTISPSGELDSIWNIEGLPHPYDVVAKAMHELVVSRPIANVFRYRFSSVGTKSNIEHRDGAITEFHHFHADIAARHQASRVDEALGALRSRRDVLKRAFDEIKPEAVALVLEWIEQNTLYRGEQNKLMLMQFQASQRYYQMRGKENLVWLYTEQNFATLRNSALGTLLVDLSDGMDPEASLRRYEAITAPTNYRRPTAAITPRMIEQAVAKLDELGLRPALERRAATLEDVSINNVLWVDGGQAHRMKDTIKDALMQTVSLAAWDSKHITKIDIENFMAGIVPNAKKIEVLFENQHQHNLVTLTTAVNNDAPLLFQWDNGFAWSYNGDVTDSVKERVKRAGGNVDAKLRVSLSWFNYDDLDLHAECPDGHVFFGYKKNILDVDMNAGAGTTREPVENLAWTSPKQGTYAISVNQYYKRESNDVGFTMEFEYDGEVQQFSFNKGVVGTVQCLSFSIDRNGRLTEFKSNLNSGGVAVSKEHWGLQTNTFIDVAAIMLSPNHWDGQAKGNKHWFFMVDACSNPQPVRGFYNEFLRPELHEHRKVFETLASKMKAEPNPKGLSGLGFSSTIKKEVTFRVTDASTTKTYKVTF